MISRLSMPWKDQGWSAEYKVLKYMDFHINLFLALSGMWVVMAKKREFLLSSIYFPSASQIRVLCWTCGFMLLFCQLQTPFEVSFHQALVPQGLLHLLWYWFSYFHCSALYWINTMTCWGWEGVVCFYTFSAKKIGNRLFSGTVFLSTDVGYNVSFKPPSFDLKNRLCKMSFLAFKGHDLYHLCCYWGVIA